MLIACNGNHKEGYGHFFRCLNLVVRYKDVISQPLVFLGDFDDFCKSQLEERDITTVGPDFKFSDLYKYKTKSLLIDSYDECFINRFVDFSNSTTVMVINDFFTNSPFDKVGLSFDYIINVRAKAELNDQVPCPRKLLGIQYYWGNMKLWQMRRQRKTENKMLGHMNLSVCFGAGLTEFSDMMIDAARALSNSSCINRRILFLTNVQHQYLRETCPFLLERYETCPLTSDVSRIFSNSDLLLSSGGLLKYEAALAGCFPICVGGTKLQEEDNENFCALGLGSHFDYNLTRNGVCVDQLQTRMKAFHQESSKVFHEENLENVRHFIHEIAGYN